MWHVPTTKISSATEKTNVVVKLRTLKYPAVKSKKFKEYFMKLTFVLLLIIIVCIYFQRQHLPYLTNYLHVHKVKSSKSNWFY